MGCRGALPPECGSCSGPAGLESIHPYADRRTLSPSMQLVAVHIKHLLCALVILGTKDTIVNESEKVTASTSGGRQTINKQI